MQTLKPQPKTKKDLLRRYFLDVTKSGHVFIREKGQLDSRGGLPVFSTDTREQAAMILAYFCRLARTGPKVYRLNRCLGDATLELEDLVTVAAEFRAHFERQAEKHAQPRGR